MRNFAPYLFMVIVQLAYAVSNILIKLSLQRGLSSLVFIIYRHLLSVILLGPLAYAFERKHFSNLSYSVVFKIFFLASLGATIHMNLYCAGLHHTSPTIAVVLSNFIPALTFIVTVLLRMEKVQIRSVRGQVKLLGTVICVGGALIFTLWKGYLFKCIVSRPLIKVHGRDEKAGAGHDVEDHIKGSTLILASFAAWSAWLIVQAKVYEVYPARLTINTVMCFFASMQNSLLALIFERKSSSWKLEWNIQLLTIVYTGIFISGLVYYLQFWCVSEKGPLFASMFFPFQLVIVAVLSAFIFAERLHLGSVIGAFIIIIGLYCVLWGKSKDDHNAEIKGKSLERGTSIDQRH